MVLLILLMWHKGEKKQEINEIDETAATLLICLVIILTPRGPHFRASIVAML